VKKSFLLWHWSWRSFLTSFSNPCFHFDISQIAGNLIVSKRQINHTKNASPPELVNFYTNKKKMITMGNKPTRTHHTATKTPQHTGTTHLLGLSFKSKRNPSVAFVQYQVPGIPSGTIKEIHSGGEYSLIETMDGQVFFTKSSSLSTLEGFTGKTPYLIVPIETTMLQEDGGNGGGGGGEWMILCHLDFKQMVSDLVMKQKQYEKEEDSYVLKQVIAAQDMIIMRTRNDLLVMFHVTSFQMHLISDYATTDNKVKQISQIVSGPLAQHFVIITKDRQLHHWNTANRAQSQVDTNKLKGKNMVRVACSGRSTFVVVQEDDDNHQLYCNGDNQFMVQSGQKSELEFILMDTPFSTQRIADIKCGYFHTIVLLENGDIYTCGYNSYSQCGFSGSDSHFRKVTFPANLWDLRPDLCIKNPFKVEKIVCSSIGTLFVSQDGFIMYGDPVPKLGYMTHALVTVENVTAMLYAFGREKVESNLVHSNTVTVGGWHVVVYQSFNKSTKSLTYFMNNLKLLTSVSPLSDITIIHSV